MDRFHDFEFEIAKRELDALSYPYYAIPGNMDTSNKHTDKNGATGREDIRLNVTAEQLDRFVSFFGDFPWSFVHKNVRFSGFYAAVAGSGLSYETRMWHWLESEFAVSSPRGASRCDHALYPFCGYTRRTQMGYYKSGRVPGLVFFY